MSFNILVDRCYLWTIPLFNCRWQRMCGMELILQYEFPQLLVQRLPISKGHTQQRFTWNVLYIFLKPTPSRVSLWQGVSILFSIHSILKLLFSKSRGVPNTDIFFGPNIDIVFLTLKTTNQQISPCKTLELQKCGPYGNILKQQSAKTEIKRKVILHLSSHEDQLKIIFGFKLCANFLSLSFNDTTSTVNNILS